jgi:hypothetical protein
VHHKPTNEQISKTQNNNKHTNQHKNKQTNEGIQMYMHINIYACRSHTCPHQTNDPIFNVDPEFRLVIDLFYSTSCSNNTTKTKPTCIRIRYICHHGTSLPYLKIAAHSDSTIDCLCL